MTEIVFCFNEMQIIEVTGLSFSVSLSICLCLFVVSLALG